MIQNSKYLKVTMAVTLMYCCLCFISSGCILYGSDKIVQFGNCLVRLWMFNPIEIILSVIGLIRRKRNRGEFILCAALSIISWMVAGMMVAMRF